MINLTPQHRYPIPKQFDVSDDVFGLYLKRAFSDPDRGALFIGTRFRLLNIVFERYNYAEIVDIYKKKEDDGKYGVVGNIYVHVDERPLYLPDRYLVDRFVKLMHPQDKRDLANFHYFLRNATKDLMQSRRSQRKIRL